MFKLHTYVRMYVCMYVRIYVCMYVCTYVHNRIKTYFGYFKMRPLQRYGPYFRASTIRDFDISRTYCT